MLFLLCKVFLNHIQSSKKFELRWTKLRHMSNIQTMTKEKKNLASHLSIFSTYFFLMDETLFSKNFDYVGVPLYEIVSLHEICRNRY